MRRLNALTLLWVRQSNYWPKALKHQSLESCQNFLSRPRQDQNFYLKTKIKSLFFVLEAPRLWSQGLNHCTHTTTAMPFRSELALATLAEVFGTRLLLVSLV